MIRMPGISAAIRPMLAVLDPGQSVTLALSRSLYQRDKDYLAVNTLAYRLWGRGGYTLRRLDEPPRVVVTNIVQADPYTPAVVNNMLAEGMSP